MVQGSTVKQPRTFEFLLLSLHIETVGGLATPLVLRGTPLPATRAEGFATAANNQESTMSFEICSGRHHFAQK
jgi:molecular chaperone DnaK (HSP70)